MKGSGSECFTKGCKVSLSWDHKAHTITRRRTKEAAVQRVHRAKMYLRDVRTLKGASYVVVVSR